MSKQSLAGGSIFSAYSRNGLGQIVKTSDPNGREWFSSLDAQGNLVSMIDPLGNSTSYQVLEEANIKRYIDINVHGVTVIVSVVSTRIPYQDAAKDFIADYDELRETIKLSMQKAFRSIKTYISRKEAEKKKEKELEKLKDHADRLAISLAKITKGIPMSESEIQHKLMKIIEREYI